MTARHTHLTGRLTAPLYTPANAFPLLLCCHSLIHLQLLLGLQFRTPLLTPSFSFHTPPSHSFHTLLLTPSWQLLQVQHLLLLLQQLLPPLPLLQEVQAAR